MTIFEGYPEISGEEIKEALDFCGGQITRYQPAGEFIQAWGPWTRRRITG